MRMICSPGFLLPGKKAAQVQWLRTGFFSPKFQLSGLGIMSKLTNSAASTRISEAQNHPLESPPSAISPPHPRTQQNKLCKNETWETLHSKGQPHTGTLLDLYKTELQPELPYENHLLLFSKPKLSSAEVSDLFWGCGSYFSGVVWQHKEDFMFSPGASCTEIQKLKPGTVGFTQ